MSYLSLPQSADATRWNQMWSAVDAFHNWLDENPARYGDPLMWRTAKIAEELGEAMQALIAHGGQNPRKPIGPMSDVVRELCDVALTAVVALRCAAGSDAAEIFAEHVDSVRRRSAASEAGQ